MFSCESMVVEFVLIDIAVFVLELEVPLVVASVAVVLLSSITTFVVFTFIVSTSCICTSTGQAIPLKQSSPVEHSSVEEQAVLASHVR